MDQTFEGMLSRFSERWWSKVFVQNGGPKIVSSRSVSPYGVSPADDTTGLIFGTPEYVKKQETLKKNYYSLQKSIQSEYGPRKNNE